jgi:hypothetical protein
MIMTLLILNDAYSDLERLEKIGTGKIKDAKKIEERAKGRVKVEQKIHTKILWIDTQIQTIMNLIMQMVA